MIIGDISNELQIRLMAMAPRVLLPQTVSDRQSRSDSMIRMVETRLGVRLPKAWRANCLVAGKERRFNQAFSYLYAQEEWVITDEKLVIMAGNQAVVLWETEAGLEPDVGRIRRYLPAFKFLTGMITEAQYRDAMGETFIG